MCFKCAPKTKSANFTVMSTFLHFVLITPAVCLFPHRNVVAFAVLEKVRNQRKRGALIKQFGSHPTSCGTCSGALTIKGLFICIVRHSGQSTALLGLYLTSRVNRLKDQHATEQYIMKEKSLYWIIGFLVYCSGKTNIYLNLLCESWQCHLSHCFHSSAEIWFFTHS